MRNDKLISSFNFYLITQIESVKSYRPPLPTSDIESEFDSDIPKIRTRKGKVSHVAAGGEEGAEEDLKEGGLGSGENFMWMDSPTIAGSPQESEPSGQQKRTSLLVVKGGCRNSIKMTSSSHHLMRYFYQSMIFSDRLTTLDTRNYHRSRIS